MRKIKVILMSVFLALFIAGCSSGTSAEFLKVEARFPGRRSSQIPVWKYIFLMWDREMLL